jgi:hypothetical protein
MEARRFGEETDFSFAPTWVYSKVSLRIGRDSPPRSAAFRPCVLSTFVL